VLNLELLRREPDHVRIASRRRGIGVEFVDRILTLDRELRSALTAAETAKAQKNAETAEIAKASDKKAAAAQRRPIIVVLDQRIAAASA
jgi:seryl-tRNA synthetase